MKKIWEKIRPLINRETVSYLVFGVLTTVINIVVSALCYRFLPISQPEALNATSQVIAWIVAVLFAFVTNKLYVFQSRSTAWKLLLWEFFSFIAARLLTLGIDVGGMILLVDKLQVNYLVSKVLTNGVVIILNYIFSKLFIFKKKEENGGKDAENGRE